MAVTKRKYTTKSCHGTKTEAKKVQKTMHDKGMTAKIVKKTAVVSGRKKVRFCVESAGRKKTAKKQFRSLIALVKKKGQKKFVNKF